MKHIVSISLGSSERDHSAEVILLNEKYIVERIGTNGDLNQAIKLIEKLDGKVDAFGMGGIDLYVWAGSRSYMIRDAMRLKAAAKHTPMVDGSGLKNTLERKVIKYLVENRIVDFQGKKVLLTSAMDRYGMAHEIKNYGGDIVIGDLIFALGINMPIYSFEGLNRIARIIAPLVCRLPFKLLYPTGVKQKEKSSKSLHSHYNKADIIAGDFHYIKRFMPDSLKDKILITNTVTERDIIELRQREVSVLITTTPQLQGRSFGTNAMEAMLVATLADLNKEATEENYYQLLEEMQLEPRVERFKYSTV
ncbi:quinate 5-dehydrogenase [Alkaliphilus serpentinus]|uniref:Quinate 5-dehydrogenase n=1 Tax=Alkaliphilus serpentinus TaxID=1482731 RepID=A0A833HSP2_9FIRM|nr:quinate 5-dehydrogenase [Alkaliphilus serpentinus]KAB3533808.1 quinate 5-dehydrogenase [Alkaliphilus serpentinus]